MERFIRFLPKDWQEKYYKRKAKVTEINRKRAITRKLLRKNKLIDFFQKSGQLKALKLFENNSNKFTLIMDKPAFSKHYESLVEHGYKPYSFNKETFSEISQNDWVSSQIIWIKQTPKTNG